MNNIPKKLKKDKINYEVVKFIELNYKEYRYTKMIPLQLLLDILQNQVSDRQVNTYVKYY